MTGYVDFGMCSEFLGLLFEEMLNWPSNGDYPRRKVRHDT